jgi:uncharacterized protein (TIGR01319 family)
MTTVSPLSGSAAGLTWTRVLSESRLRTEGILLVDFGSTYTKVTAIELETGRLLGVAQHPTTVDTDLLDGFRAAKDALIPQLGNTTMVDVLACSSAGGGLRLAVIGLEPDLTAEAARRSALNAGARVVTVINGGLSMDKLDPLVSARPDIILLVGGTNGGNASSLGDSARVLAGSSLDVPIVLAGNEDAQPLSLEILNSRGKHVVAAANLMPEIGTIQEQPVRQAIREIFVEHVIGGKHLSSASSFAEMVRMPTPDAVLTAAELLAEGTDTMRGLGELMVIDVGGATTDVHSVIPSDSRAGYASDLLADGRAQRTVEADLGLRWNAGGIVDAAERELASPGAAAHLRDAADRRVADPHWVSEVAGDMAEDIELARYAMQIAIRRHAGRLTVELSPSGATLRRSGRDLRTISTIVLSGGIFRHISVESLSDLIPEHAEKDGLMLPKRATVAVDRAYVLAAAGLLASRDRQAAFNLMNHALVNVSDSPEEDSNCPASN